MIRSWRRMTTMSPRQHSSFKISRLTGGDSVLHSCDDCIMMGTMVFLLCFVAMASTPCRVEPFALPAFVPATDRRGASLDLKQFTLPGATVVRAIDGSAQYLWFCSCSPENVVIKRTAEALHMMAGGCSDVKSATCDCVQFCQAILSNSGVDVGDMIEVAPMHHADDDGGSGRGKLHTLCSC